MILGKNIQCTGCGLCEVVCPKNTLKIKKSSEGFYKSFQVNDNCNECGLCERICPFTKLMNSIDLNPLYQHIQRTLKQESLVLQGDCT